MSFCFFAFGRESRLWERLRERSWLGIRLNLIKRGCPSCFDWKMRMMRMMNG